MSTDFMQAVKNGDRERIELMLAADAELAGSTENGVSAVLVAIYYGHREVADLIARSRQNLDIFEAAALGDTDRLLDAIRSEPSGVGAYSADGWTPLHLAAAFGGRPTVGVLLVAGADPNQRSTNRMHNQPLHACVALSHSTEIANLLLERGADIDAQQFGGFTALHAAAFQGDIAMVRLLLNCSADPSICTDDGQTALDLAREKNSREVLSLLAAHVSRASS